MAMTFKGTYFITLLLSRRTLTKYALRTIVHHDNVHYCQIYHIICNPVDIGKKQIFFIKVQVGTG